MKLKDIAENHGLTPEGVDYALNQYRIVINEITNGMLSKLTYDAKYIISTAQERWCDTCDLKEQKAVEPGERQCQHGAQTCGLSMNDLDEVIKGLRRVLFLYKRQLMFGWRGDAEIYREHMETVSMAIALLEEQKPVEPTFTKDRDGVFAWACGACGAYLYHIYEGIDKASEYAKYCRQCGKEVKWK